MGYSNSAILDYESDNLLLNKRNNNDQHHDISYVDLFGDLSRNFTSTIDKVKNTNSTHDQPK
jgi:hypothetical protein